MAIDIIADLFASIKSPAYWVERQQENWMVVNPHIFGEISAEIDFTIKLWLLDVTLKSKIMGYRFAPIDYQMAWDLNNKDRFCYSVGNFQEVLDVTVEVETLVSECMFGIIGWSTQTDPRDCTWRSYQPQLPIWGIGLLDRADKVRDYVAWTCSDGSELSTWDDRPDLDGDGEPDEHFHGWEPSNIDDGDDIEEGDDWADDGWDESGSTIFFD